MANEITQSAGLINTVMTPNLGTTAQTKQFNYTEGDDSSADILSITTGGVDLNAATSKDASIFIKNNGSVLVMLSVKGTPDVDIGNLQAGASYVLPLKASVILHGTAASSTAEVQVILHELTVA